MFVKRKMYHSRFKTQNACRNKYWGPLPPLFIHLGRQNIIHMMKWTRPSLSVFAYCKQSKTGWWEGLGTRLDSEHCQFNSFVYSKLFHTPYFILCIHICLISEQQADNCAITMMACCQKGCPPLLQNNTSEKTILVSKSSGLKTLHV